MYHTINSTTAVDPVVRREGMVVSCENTYVHKGDACDCQGKSISDEMLIELLFISKNILFAQIEINVLP